MVLPPPTRGSRKTITKGTVEEQELSSAQTCPSRKSLRTSSEAHPDGHKHTDGSPGSDADARTTAIEAKARVAGVSEDCEQ